MLTVRSLKARFYDPAKGWRDGTSQYRDLVLRHVKPSDTVLDVGAGDGRGFSHALKGKVRAVVGLDPDAGVLANESLDRAVVGTVEQIPLPDGSVDCAVSSFVLEHVADPRAAAAEVFRVLRPGGCFVFRTPNLYHYVTLVSKLTPHRLHLLLANRARGMKDSAREPFATFYRCNTRRTVKRVCGKAGFATEELRTIEAEPSYLQFCAVAFLLGVGYERLVNSTQFLAPFRVVILGVCRKPERTK